MLFTDPVFLFMLLPAACALFYSLTPRMGSSAGMALLLGISLLFYWTWGTFYLLVLAASCTVNFAAACTILVTPNEQRQIRRAALLLGQAYNFGALIWFKYRLVGLIFGGAQQQYSLIEIAIPVGISFYTFQQAILLLDAYHRDASVVAYLGDMRTLLGKLRGYLRHAFFVSFFPHLVIGPIVYLSEFQPQVQNADFGRAKRLNLEVGSALIIIGLFKKMVIADHLAPIAHGVFGADAGAALSGQTPMAVAWLGTLAYYTQLYFDFSGYSDMALGSARLLGIRFPMNFFSPLKAVGIIDFYRRWHITLTRAIARFVYTPLSISAARFAVESRWPAMPVKIVSVWIPLLINFEVIALWHGARQTFIVFGLVHGVWYAAETATRSSRVFKAWCAKTSVTSRAILGRLLFLLLMPVTFALFRSATLPNFMILLRSLIGFDAGVVQTKDALEVLAAVGIAGLLPNSMQLVARYRAGFSTYTNRNYTPPPLRLHWRPNWLWTIPMSGMLLTCLYYMSRQPPFLYLGF
ncbi:MAG: alginate O-acetyltransferase complex protein AlgI [Gammaproteobacteria bacterium]|jgi:alginate O-acetyltransferase complex protein AlgI|nr:alginate O-acetyltransferase complex protein AlgI [Gammaproteobacteria bacterium]